MTQKSQTSRRSVLKTMSIAVIGSTAVASSAAARQEGQGPPADRGPQVDTEDTNLVNIQDEEGHVRLDNNNNTPVRIRIESNGDLDGRVYTVGAGRSGPGNPGGRVIRDAEPGQSVDGIEVKRPQDGDDAWSDGGLTGTATID